MTQPPSFRDVEKLSAYLDGQLKPSERARLESRLQSDPELASVLKDLRQSRNILRQLPQRRAPRNFTLTPKMVGQKPPLPRSYPVFRFATVLATLLLFFTFATNFVAPHLARPAAPAAYGMGGYGGGGGGEPELPSEAAPEAAAPAATEAPAMQAPAATEAPAEAPAPTLAAPTTNDNAGAEATPQASEKSGIQQAPPNEPLAQQAAPVQTPQTKPAKPPINATWQIVLAGIAIVSGLTAFILRYSAIRKWHAKAK
jgi:anti-sigma factor RsiW